MIIIEDDGKKIDDTFKKYNLDAIVFLITEE